MPRLRFGVAGYAHAALKHENSVASLGSYRPILVDMTMLQRWRFFFSMHVVVKIFAAMGTNDIGNLICHCPVISETQPIFEDRIFATTVAMRAGGLHLACVA